MLTCFFTAVAQIGNTLKSVIDKTEEFNKKMPVEKLYMQFDKAYYSVGDTIWFKGYLFNPALSYSPMSSRLYIELVNDSNRVVKKIITPVSVGTTFGQIELDEATVTPGAFTIRAYTNWMRNFGEDHFFYKDVYIGNPNADSWIINANTVVDGTSTNKLKTNLKFTDWDKKPIQPENLQIKVLNDKKVIYQTQGQAKTDGSLSVDLELPQVTALKDLTILAQDKENRKAVSIPVKINRTQDVDVQFMPESGYLIASLPARVGFKALGEDGRGVNIKGVVYDGAGNEITQFEAIHAGMGYFDMVPQAGTSYAAKIILPGGESKTVNLPELKPAGTLLKVKNRLTRDTLDISVLATPDLPDNSKTFSLVAQARGLICYAATFELNAAGFVNIHLAKSLFPDGIAHLALLNSQNQQVNERLVYINRNDNLKIDVNTASKFAYRDSIPLTISVHDAAGKPVVGSFSVAVTDNAQVQPDSATENNIVLNTLLTDDLKGEVESPGFYFSKSETAWQGLEALMLTQGWTGYNWATINQNPPTISYVPEPEFLITGTVTNLFNKPVAKANVVLLTTGKYNLFKDTITNTEGRFMFRKLPLFDTVKFVLQARNQHGRTIKAGITVDEIPKASYKLPRRLNLNPWYINSNDVLLNYVKTNIAYQNQLSNLIYSNGGKLLHEVNIRQRAGVSGSKNLNGAGASDQVITAADLDKAGKMTIFDLLLQKVKNFYVGAIPRTNNMGFFVKEKRARFVVDGIDIDQYYQSSSGPGSDSASSGPPIPNERFEYEKEALSGLTAEDVKGIEVLYSAEYTNNYHAIYPSTDTATVRSAAGGVGADLAYIEITTRSGSGPVIANYSGVYLYRPWPLSLPKEFYRPRYAAKNKQPGFTDQRSTLYWKPNIITDKNGNATVSFYAGDKNTTYTITTEGSNLSGNVGTKKQQISIVGKLK